MTVTVYSKPGCVQCDATERQLMRHGVQFITVDLTQHPGALKRIKDLGYRQAPVVVADGTHWSGFRPDKIKSLALSGGEGASSSPERAPRARF